MRPDMFKVIVERPRLGHHFSNNNHRKAEKHARATGDWDFLPRRQGIRKADSIARHNSETWGDRKQLNEHLNPLRNYLRSKVGQRWDDVYSEICEYINVNSAVQLHIRQHISDYVLLAENVYYDENGNPQEKGSGRRRRYGYTIWEDLYVCPNTNILCRTPKRVRKRAREVSNKVFHPGEKNVVWVKIKNVWFELLLREIEWRVEVELRIPKWVDGFYKRESLEEARRKYTHRVERKYSVGFDILLKEHASRDNEYKRNSVYGSKELYAYSKRTLGKKDLRKLPAGWR